MVREIGIRRFLVAATVGAVLGVVVALTDAGALAAYGAVLVGGLVYMALVHRDEHRSGIPRPK